MTVFEKIEALGANVKEGENRFGGDRDFYLELLKMVPSNVESMPVLSMLEAGDYDTALSNAHTLKGIMGNLSLTPLYEAYSDIVNHLRHDERTEAMDIIKEILPIQEEILEILSEE